LLAGELARDEAWVETQVRAYREMARGWLLKPEAAPERRIA
jgi:hypothetical protein